MTSSTSAKALVLSLTVGLAQVAAAEAFNDRSENFLAQVQPGSQPFATGIVATSPSHFNDRSGDFPASLKSGTHASPLAEVVASTHFNDRSDTDRSMEPALTETSSLTAAAERSAPVVPTPAAGS